MAPAHAPVEMVCNGQPRAVVYLADPRATEKLDPKKHSGFASELPRLIQELVEVIRLSTGATLELVDQPPPGDRPAIVIGDCDQTRKAGIDAAEIPVEGFVVKTALNRVYLVGSTQALPPGSERWAKWANEGTAWAVADFLERLVGVRMVLAGGAWRPVPRAPSIARRAADPLPRPAGLPPAGVPPEVRLEAADGGTLFRQGAARVSAGRHS